MIALRGCDAAAAVDVVSGGGGELGIIFCYKGKNHRPHYLMAMVMQRL
jgi:hypothetical protein